MISEFRVVLTEEEYREVMAARANLKALDKTPRNSERNQSRKATDPRWRTSETQLNGSQ